MARVEVESEVTGKVWKVEVGVGDRVAEGDILVILESMKMEIPVESPQRGDCRRTAGGTGATGAGRSGGGRHRDLTPVAPAGAEAIGRALPLVSDFCVFRRGRIVPDLVTIADQGRCRGCPFESSRKVQRPVPANVRGDCRGR